MATYPPVYAYKRGPSLGKKNDDPEFRFQCDVAKDLENLAMSRMLRGVYGWTASAAGARVGMQTATKLKRMGVKRGWPDLQFLCADGVTRYIELKAGASLSPEQRRFRDVAEPHGIWALCKTRDEVLEQLALWGLLAPAFDRRVLLRGRYQN